MFISKVVGAVAALAALAVAQQESTTSVKPTGTYTTSASKTGTATTSATSGPATHSIAVGAEGFIFSPNQLTAKVGDTVRFVFYPGGHAVARSSFKFPCIPYEYAGLHRTGFWTGPKTPQAATGNVWYDVKVNDTEPIFFYCAAPGSCVDHHMIGVVNPTANETFDAQMEYAERVQFQLAPGDPWPSETAGDQPTETSEPNYDKPKAEESNSRLSAGAIAGIAIGSAAVLILAAALIYICGRRGGFDKAYRKSVAPPGGGAGGPQSPMVEQSNYAASTIPSANPKSPGQASFSTYSGMPDHDPFRSHTASPQHPYFNGSYNGSPPPLSTGGLHPSYASYHSNTPPQGLYAHPVGELSAQQSPPVELPTGVGIATATTPGSPPPQYPTSARRDSWTAGEEGSYRPGNK
ncbi:hypothetical protein V8F20_001921 [Naviculisporaceae sp. PSN 640]